jgi:hypothetical protein
MECALGALLGTAQKKHIRWPSAASCKKAWFSDEIFPVDKQQTETLDHSQKPHEGGELILYDRSELSAGSL